MLHNDAILDRDMAVSEELREQIASLQAQRQIWLDEALHYRLRKNAVKGFQLAYRYSRDATLNGDPALDALIEAELWQFLEKKPWDEDGRYDNLERRHLLGFLYMRPVIRAWANQDYSEALEQAVRLRRENSDLLHAGRGLTEATLATWEAFALVFRAKGNDLHAARQELDRVIAYLKQPEMTPTDDDPAYSWRARAVLAFAYRVRGYLNRVQGQINEAIDDYLLAAPLWEHINLRVELAQTKNDLGFAYAEKGDYENAEALVLEALDMRKELGPRNAVGLSLNTLAAIAIRAGYYEQAVRYGERAYRLFRATEFLRGEGLALISLAEAKRRRSGELEVNALEQRVALLQTALKHAEDAYEIFEELKEGSRQVEAAIEMGCAYRNWAWAAHNHPELPYDEDELVAQGRQWLERASSLAPQNDMLFRHVDALVNLAWLGYYAGRLELVEDAQQAIFKAVPPDYLLDPATMRPNGRPPRRRAQAQSSVWLQLGKLYVLLGHLAHRLYGEQGYTNHLVEAGHKYTLGMAYNQLFGPNSRDMTRAKREIYDRVRTLSPAEKRWLAEGVEKEEERFGYRPSVMRTLLVSRAAWYGK